MSTTCCTCDERRFPPEPGIAAGLSALPLQVLGFPEYRRAMLAAVRSHAPLAGWRARHGDDLGLMLIEWWAYVLDIVAFYDQQHTQNQYLRTATDAAMTRRITGLIGYRPRPAVAAEGLIAAIADAGPDIVLPPWTAFRSEAFGSEPPQVFENDGEERLSWRTNRWTLAPISETVSDGGAPLFEVASLRLVRGAWAVFAWGSSTAAARVVDISPVRAVDGVTYARVTTDPAVTIPAGTALSSVSVQMATATAGLNRVVAAAVSGSDVMLDAQYPQLAPGQRLLFVAGTTTNVRNISTGASAVATVLATPRSALSASVPTLPVTQVTLTAALASSMTAAATTVHFQFVRAGRIVRPARMRVQRADLNPSAALVGPAEPLADPAPGPFLVQDRDRQSVTLDGSIAVASSGAGLLSPASSAEPFAQPLVPPIELFGNIVHIIRGETVPHEVLGSGDATVRFPSFKLKKKPLTYVPSAAAPGGRRSTLEIRVNGIRWREVDSFFGTTPGDEIYIARQNEDQETFVTFWRLPSGVNNVVARYRFGAGAAKPPAGSITQAVRPVKGVKIISPVAPTGGADADRPRDIKRNAAASSLTLGRAISLADFEALARSFGVTNVTAGWAWDPRSQRAVVTLWYVPDGGDVSTALRTFLVGQADPETAVVVTPATPIPTTLLLDVVVDARFDRDAVLSALVTAITDPETGPLAHTNVPIGGSVFRSVLLARAAGVAGVASINGITTNGLPMPMALTAPEGQFLDFIPFTNV
jgi:hypothetical protein